MYSGLSPASGESMLTGSPPSGFYNSPPTIAPTSGSPKASFLPPYLLGSGHQPGQSESQHRSYQNFGGSHHVSSFSSPASNPQQHHVTWSPDLVQRIPSSTKSNLSNRFAVGPPVRSLDASMGTRLTEPNVTVPFDRMNGSSTTAFRTVSPSMVIEAATEGGMMNGHGDDESSSPNSDDLWVTIFGFPSDSANYILKEFSAYGTIRYHEFASKGNWVHIRYQSAMQARKALSKNGHLFAQNTIRVGVTQCIDKDVMRRYQRKHVLSNDIEDDDVGTKRLKTSTSTSRIPISNMTSGSARLFSQFDTSTPVRPGPVPALQRFDNHSAMASAASPCDSLNRSSRLGSMRSLTAAYENSRTEQGGEIVNGTENGNLLTKAWKYIFSL